MMDVYHPDFRNSIAVDARIKKITRTLGLTFRTYEEEEKFYLDVAERAGLKGWDLDRIMYRFRDSVIEGLQEVGDIAAARKALREGDEISWDQIKKELNF
jgi:hypothetical protein